MEEGVPAVEADDDKRILVVDDDRDFVSSLVDILENRGFAVQSAYSAKGSEKRIRGFAADVALLDVRLGRDSGIDLIDKLRLVRPRLLCVMMTAYAAVDTAILALDQGAYAYLRKPLEIRDLFATLERCFEKLRLEDEKAAAEEALRLRNEKLREVNARLKAVARSTHEVVASAGYKAKTRLLLEELARNMGADGGSLYLLEAGSLVLTHSLDPGHAPLTIPLPLAKGCLFDRAMETGQPILVEDMEAESDLVRSGWTGYASGSAMVVPLSKEEGDLTGLAALHSKRRSPFSDQDREIAVLLAAFGYETIRGARAVEDLYASEERFRTLVTSARDCIFIKDTSRRYTFINPATSELLGLPPSEILGKTDGHIFDGHAANHLRYVDHRVLKGEGVEEEHSRRINGVPYTFLDTRVPMYDSAGTVIGMCGTSRNITDRKPRVEIVASAANEYNSKAMRATLAAAGLAAKSESIVLLTGESGVGKDYLARYIHDHSERANGPFFSINCAAVAQELAESELFGHEANAFTGANRRKRGLLELAEGGTLLLNEVGELSLRLQAKLLTFLDTRIFTRVGGERSVTVNARLIAATNRELERDVEKGRFRVDLFHRLNVFSIQAPPLRERVEDIPNLAESIVSQLAVEMQLPEIPEIDDKTVNVLKRYSWPGNVRELRNVLERSLILSGGRSLRADLIDVEPDTQREWTWSIHFPPVGPMNETVKDLKRSLVEEALKRSGGNRREAAELLGMTRYALKRQLKTLGLSGSD